MSVDMLAISRPGERCITLELPHDRPFRLGVLSDTHRFSRPAPVPPEALDRLSACEAFVHCGDFIDPAFLDPLREIGPVFAVLGNVDPAQLAPEFPRQILLFIGSWRIGIIHAAGNGERAWRRTAACFSEPLDLLLYGHSHRPIARHLGDLTVVNPGSAVDPRGLPNPSVASIELSTLLSVHLMALPLR
ncbi:MAG: metallophosphatase family protein [Chloroflexi bacterium]|nr:metallophosphatase family protein [Chloroflexota bacterium]